MTAKYRSLVDHFSLAFVSRGKFQYYGSLVALLLAHSESILHILLTIQDFFSLFVEFLMLMILYILMESDRAVQQRQQAKINEHMSLGAYARKYGTRRHMTDFSCRVNLSF